ncbi:FAD binding domain-containing protein, partial [Mycena pura]
MSGMPPTADAVIVGGGPVGSLIAYQLARFGCTPYLIEQEDKESAACYGRATTLWPRTIELLDQLDVAERLLQIGAVTRNGLHFRDGRRSHGGLMFGSRMDRLGDTYFKFALHLRQRLTEQQFTEALEEMGIQHHMRQRIEGFTIDESAEDGYPVTVRARDLTQDKVVEIKTKYLIGADGGRSTVRSLAGIAFTSERTMHRWIRMDARVKTNMPNPRCLNSIDSKGHGQILWCPIDNGLTRIGYVFSQALLEKYGGVEGVTQEVAVKEAIQALQPFQVEFIEVDWFTIYGIGQAIAETFCAQDRVFLAGDACHTHSSGSAQGLNTGVHDAVNLSWKLAVRSLCSLCARRLIDGPANSAESWQTDSHGLCATSNRQRQSHQHAHLGPIPSSIPRPQGAPTRSPDRVVHGHERPAVHSWTRHIVPRLMIVVATNIINSASSDPSAATIGPGERGPDVYLTTIGIVVFAGNPALSRASLVALQTALAAPTAFTRAFPARRVFRVATLAAACGNGAADVLPILPGMRRAFGRVFWDPAGAAHGVYGVDEARGAVVVFRPDGCVGCVVALENVLDLGAYFAGFLVPEPGV